MLAPNAKLQKAVIETAGPSGATLQLLARIYECLPLTCEKCGQPMRLIAFIMEPPVVEKILTHISHKLESGQDIETIKECPELDAYSSYGVFIPVVSSDYWIDAVGREWGWE